MPEESISSIHLQHESSEQEAQALRQRIEDELLNNGLVPSEMGLPELKEEYDLIEKAIAGEIPEGFRWENFSESKTPRERSLVYTYTDGDGRQNTNYFYPSKDRLAELEVEIRERSQRLENDQQRYKRLQTLMVNASMEELQSLLEALKTIQVTYDHAEEPRDSPRNIAILFGEEEKKDYLSEVYTQTCIMPVILHGETVFVAFEEGD